MLKIVTGEARRIPAFKFDAIIETFIYHFKKLELVNEAATENNFKVATISLMTAEFVI
jgi:hypothetical protein|tara:strand:+ start:7085 stop:7258 length:174 start_codon:yes stop_codon:yes gene_type:complete